MLVFFVRLDPSFDDRTMLRSRFVYPFISGASAAAIATTMTQPFDVIKTNIQGVDGWFKRRGGYFTNYNGFSSVAHVVSRVVITKHRIDVECVHIMNEVKLTSFLILRFSINLLDLENSRN